jgi:hypothetical protein
MKAIKKIIFLTLIGVLPTAKCVAQNFKHGVGLQANIFSFKEAYTDNTGINYPVLTTVTPGFVYKASLGFNINRDLTLSLATYPFIGIYPKGETSGYLSAEIPLLAEFFYGDLDYFGGFIGVGGSFAYTKIPGFGDGNVIGPQIVAGLQFPFQDQVVEAKLAYTYGLNKPSINAFPNRVYTKADRSLFSLGLIYMFGGY